MYSEQNRAADMRGHRTMNLPIPIVGTRLWASCEPLKYHMLDILRPYILQDVWRLEIPLNHHVIPALQTIIFGIFFGFFCASYQKSRNLLPSMNFMSWWQIRF